MFMELRARKKGILGGLFFASIALMLLAMWNAEPREVRFIYMVQGPDAPPQWLCKIGARSDSKAMFLAWKSNQSKVCPTVSEYLYVPGSTWTAGRNALYEHASAMVRQENWNTEYFIFMDEDCEISIVDPDEKMDAYSMIHTLLRNVQPAVASVSFRTFQDETHRIIQDPRNLCGPAAPCAPSIDAAFAAFHITAAPIFLPYDGHFDAASWWMSQALLIQVMAATIPEYVVQFNQVYVTNGAHRKYPRGLVSAENVTKYLEGRVNSCLQDGIRRTNSVVLKSVDADLARPHMKKRNKERYCRQCSISSACEASPFCLPKTSTTKFRANRNEVLNNELVNYAELVKCKPFS
jgi:hypothetical protein